MVNASGSGTDADNCQSAQEPSPSRGERPGFDQVRGLLVQIVGVLAKAAL
jgi:hypothetical protein